MWDLGSSIYLCLGLRCDLSSLDIIFIDDELEGPIFVVLEVFEPIVKIISEPFVGLHKMLWQTAPLSGPSSIRICLLLCRLGCDKR